MRLSPSAMSASWQWATAHGETGDQALVVVAADLRTEEFKYEGPGRGWQSVRRDDATMNENRLAFIPFQADSDAPLEILAAAQHMPQLGALVATVLDSTEGVLSMVPLVRNDVRAPRVNALLSVRSAYGAWRSVTALSGPRASLLFGGADPGAPSNGVLWLLPEIVFVQEDSAWTPALPAVR